MKKLLIIGGSGAGMVAASVAERIEDIELLGFINDYVEGEIGDYKKVPVVGTSKDIEKFLEDENVFFFCAFEGIRNPYKSYEAWQKLRERIPRERFINLIDPNAVIPEEYLDLGVGILAAPFVQVSPDAIISDNVMLLGNAFVGHNSFIGEFSHVTTNSVVGAFAHIGKGVTVGMNSTVIGRVHIGDFCLVGAGSVVTKDVPSDKIIAGNPAKIMRDRGELNYLKKGERNVRY